MGVCQCYNLAETNKTNIKWISNVSQNRENGAKVINKEKWLRNKMYETKYIKIYFKDAYNTINLH